MLSTKENIFYIIDGYGLIFRSFFALPKLTTREGEPIGAVYGFFKTVIGLINSSKPTHIAIALDTGYKTFRNKLYDDFIEQQNIKEIYNKYKMTFVLLGIEEDDIFNIDNKTLLSRLNINKEKCIKKCLELNIINTISDNNEDIINKIPKSFILIYRIGLTDMIKVEKYKTQYKANRPECPKELVSQFKIVREFIDSINIRSESVYGFEADDIIASLAYDCVKQNNQVVVVSGDKDLTQLVKNGKIGIFDPSKKQYLDEGGVLNKFGVRPDQIVDYLSIIGDRSDNVIGVNGIGPKGAIKLLKEYGNIENIYSNIDKLDIKTKEKFIEGKDWLTLARKLIKLRFDACKMNSIDDYKLNINHIGLAKFMDKYGFRDLETLNRKKELQNIAKNNITNKGLF